MRVELDLQGLIRETIKHAESQSHRARGFNKTWWAGTAVWLRDLLKQVSS